MATYNLNGFSTTDFINQSGGAVTTGSFINLDSSWDISTDVLNYSVTDDDTSFSGTDTQSGSITDANGDPVSSGNITLGDAYVLSSGSQTITMYEVLVNGFPAGYVADGYVFPGVTYEVIDIQPVTDINAPDYAAIEHQQYDPDVANFPPGGDFDDTLYVGAGDDIVSAGGGDDIVYAGDGADQLNGGSGTDNLYGEAGDDLFYVTVGDEVTNIDGGADWDTLTFDRDNATWGVQIDFTTATGGTYGYSSTNTGTVDNVEAFNLTDYSDWFHGELATGPIDAFGYGGDDYIATGSGADWVEGGDGDDTIYSGAGADVVFGDAGNDTIYYGAGGATQADGNVVYGGAGDDFIDDVQNWYGSYDDWLFGEAGDDTIRGGGGDDTIDGGDGQDFIFGELGDDTLVGGADQDIFFFENDWGTDTVMGGSTVTTGTDFDTLNFSTVFTPINVTFTGAEAGTVTEGANTVTFEDIEGIVGGSADDTIDASADTYGVLLRGGDGADTITGGSGSDTLIGETGDDIITTGAGYDRIVFSDNDGNDTITDFDLGDDDLDGATNDQFNVASLTDADGNQIKAFDVTVTDDGSGNAVLNFPNGETITLLGIAPEQLSTSADLNAMGIPCYASGTRIMTPSGERLVEDLRQGDMISTLNGGAQPLLWSGSRALSQAELAAQPELRPVLIRDGALGNRGDLLVSPQHAMAVDHILTDHDGPVFVRAKQLLRHGDGRIRIANGKRGVTYHHLLLPRHAVLLANGAPSESLYPGRFGLAGFDRQTKAELFDLFPGLAPILVAPERDLGARIYGRPALPILKGRQLRSLTLNELMSGHVANINGLTQALVHAPH
ncbi:MAG: Hint domain-containing protein [Maritimibacter sp.]